jgi:HPt (histidine-containing phosphotransfer) domain-containing protein
MTAMPLGIEWMPSPPLVPDDGPLDLTHLTRMTMGDAALEREVLAMFAAQSADLAARLAGLPADADRLAHTLKGSARAIGAFRVAEAAAALETALRLNQPAQASLAGLLATLAEARTAIDALLNRS